MADAVPSQRVVVGVDGSPAARAALDWAADEALRREAPLVVVEAWVPQGPMAGPLIAPIANVWTETIERSRKDLQAQVQPLLDRGVPLTTQLLGGPPHEALEMLSDDAALVVVGSSGRGSIGRKVLGSVSCHVVQHARCPVVVIPPAVSKQWESPPQP